MSAASYQVTDFIITPTYNERNNVRALIEKIFALYPALHVLVVDDCSPDGTADVVKELRLQYPNLHLKQRAGKLGLASAYLESMKEILAVRPNLRAIITMDADLAHDPAALEVLLSGLETYDLVIGSRYVWGGSIQDWEWHRHLLSWAGNLYARIVTRSHIHDLTGGFNAYRASLLRRYDLDAITAKGYGFQIEMKISAKHLGASIHEIPITFSNRTEGQSKLSYNIIYEGLLLSWRCSPLYAILKSARRNRRA